MRVIVGLTLILLVPAVAGCGTNAPTRSAGGAAANTPGAAAFRYARCMRSHGVGEFPDPQVTSSPGETSIRQVAPASLASSPHWKSAQEACRGLMPGPGSVADHPGPGGRVLLAFARCLRAHGMSDFPDPDPEGRITHQMLSAAGVNLRTPVFLSAAKACIGVTHGAITPAEIGAAIRGPH